MTRRKQGVTNIAYTDDRRNRWAQELIHGSQSRGSSEEPDATVGLRSPDLFPALCSQLAGCAQRGLVAT